MRLRRGAWGRAPNRRHPLPTLPGHYFWTEWGVDVEVYVKRPGRNATLYVKPPGGVAIKVTPFIAGAFLPPRSKSLP